MIAEQPSKFGVQLALFYWMDIYSNNNIRKKQMEILSFLEHLLFFWVASYISMSSTLYYIRQMTI